MTVPASKVRVCQTVRRTNPCVVPYSTKMGPLSSAEGESVEVCTLSNGNATCKAQLDYGSPCGVPNPGVPGEDSPNSGNSARCGEPDASDGICAWSAVNRYFCTVPCRTAPELDCNPTVRCVAPSVGAQPICAI